MAWCKRGSGLVTITGWAQAVPSHSQVSSNLIKFEFRPPKRTNRPRAASKAAACLDRPYRTCAGVHWRVWLARAASRAAIAEQQAIAAMQGRPAADCFIATPEQSGMPDRAEDSRGAALDDSQEG